MGKVIVLVGEAGVGKTTLEQRLQEKGVERLISHTSRPKRIGEKNGLEYYFRDTTELKSMIEKEQVVEKTMYVVSGNELYYALSKEEMEKRKKFDYVVVTINPHGTQQLLEHEYLHDDLIIVRVTTPIKERVTRYLDRENWSEQSLINLGQRIEEDLHDFAYFDNYLAKEIKRLGIPLIEFNNTDFKGRDDIDKIIGGE